MYLLHYICLLFLCCNDFFVTNKDFHKPFASVLQRLQTFTLQVMYIFKPTRVELRSLMLRMDTITCC